MPDPRFKVTIQVDKTGGTDWKLLEEHQFLSGDYDDFLTDFEQLGSDIEDVIEEEEGLFE